MPKQSATPRRNRLTIPVSETERREIKALALKLGYSTQSFTRLLFAFAIAHADEIARYLVRQKLGTR